MEERDTLSNELKERWHADPKNWKFGFFYYNLEDKRVFPPKRIKSMGWTVHFANLNSILCMLLILFAMIGLAIFLAFILRNI